MPTTVILKGGGQLITRGDSVRTAMFRSLLHPFWLFAIALNGRNVQFKRRQRIAYVFQPEAEYQAQVDAEAKKAEEQAKAQAEAQAKHEAERAAALKKAAEDAIAKYGPDPANWPESMKPKPQAAPPLVTP